MNSLFSSEKRAEEEKQKLVSLLNIGIALRLHRHLRSVKP